VAKEPTKQIEQIQKVTELVFLYHKVTFVNSPCESEISHTMVNQYNSLKYVNTKLNEQRREYPRLPTLSPLRHVPNMTIARQAAVIPKKSAEINPNKCHSKAQLR
jgi:hypothetical protein